MLFEVLVLLLTSWNAFDRPRMASLRLASALHRDGMTFFMVRSPCYHEVDHIRIAFIPGSHHASSTESRPSHYQQTKRDGYCSFVRTSSHYLLIYLFC